MANFKKIARVNPSNISSPVGKYSHVSIIPKNSDLYSFSGQIGIDLEGIIPNSLSEQIINTFNNIKLSLESQYLNSNDVAKLNIWATEEINWDLFYEKWDAFFGSTYPSMTIAYVKGLGLPEIKIEIEIWAAKSI